MIFDHMIEPKIINNREITAPELLTFMRVYTQMFQEGEGSFPRAMTMLEATADANNRYIGLFCDVLRTFLGCFKGVLGMC